MKEYPCVAFSNLFFVRKKGNLQLSCCWSSTHIHIYSLICVRSCEQAFSPIFEALSAVVIGWRGLGGWGQHFQSKCINECINIKIDRRSYLCARLIIGILVVPLSYRSSRPKPMMIKYESNVGCKLDWIQVNLFKYGIIE